MQARCGSEPRVCRRRCTPTCRWPGIDSTCSVRHRFFLAAFLSIICRNRFHCHSEIGFRVSALMDRVTVVSKHTAVQTRSYCKSRILHACQIHTNNRPCCRSKIIFVHHLEFLPIFMSLFLLLFVQTFVVSLLKPVKRESITVSPDNRDWFRFLK